MVSPAASLKGGAEKAHSFPLKGEQPVDLREGVTNAYNVLSEVCPCLQWCGMILKIAKFVKAACYDSVVILQWLSHDLGSKELTI